MLTLVATIFAAGFAGLALNDAGDVGGTLDNTPAVWRCGADAATALPLPASLAGGRVLSLNNQGVAVGTAGDGSGLRWDAPAADGGHDWSAATVTALPWPPIAVNDAGLIARRVPGMVIRGLTENGRAFGSFTDGSTTDMIPSHWPIGPDGLPAGPAVTMLDARLPRGGHIAGLSPAGDWAAVNASYGHTWLVHIENGQPQWQDVGPGVAWGLSAAVTGDHYDSFGSGSPAEPDGGGGRIWHPRLHDQHGHGHYGETVSLSGTWRVIATRNGRRLLLRRDGRCELRSATPAADLNCDGRVNNFDIDSFVAGLGLGGAGTEPCQVTDFNGDGRVDFFDIDPFLEALGFHDP